MRRNTARENGSSSPDPKRSSTSLSCSRGIGVKIIDEMWGSTGGMPRAAALFAPQMSRAGTPRDRFAS